MSTSVNSLSAGVQQLYNQSYFPSSVTATTLRSSSASQLNQLASASIANQQAGALLGLSSDSSSLSSTASSALVQQINPSATANSDPLSAAVSNALLSQGNHAASKFLPQSSTTGSQINVVG